MLLHSSRPEHDCLHVRLGFSSDTTVPLHKRFIHPLKGQIIKTARLGEFLGDEEVQRVLEVPTNGRRRFVFFEVMYHVGKYTQNGGQLGIYDIRYQFSDFILPHEEKPFDHYSYTEVEALHTALRAITSIAKIP